MSYRTGGYMEDLEEINSKNLYEYYLNGDFDFCGYVPSVSRLADRAEKIFKIPFSHISDSLPGYLYSQSEIKEYKCRLHECRQVL